MVNNLCRFGGLGEPLRMRWKCHPWSHWSPAAAMFGLGIPGITGLSTSAGTGFDASLSCFNVVSVCPWEVAVDHGCWWIFHMMAMSHDQLPIISNMFIIQVLYKPIIWDGSAVLCHSFQDANHQRFGLGGWWPLPRPCAADVGHGAHAWGSGDPGHAGAFVRRNWGCFGRRKVWKMPNKW